MKFTIEDYKDVLPKTYLTLTTHSPFTVVLVKESLIITTSHEVFEVLIEKNDLIANIILRNKSISAPFHWEDIIEKKIHFYYLRAIVIELMYRKNKKSISFIKNNVIDNYLRPSLSKKETEDIFRRPIDKSLRTFHDSSLRVEENMSLEYNLNKETLYYEIIPIFFSTNRKRVNNDQYFSKDNAYTITSGKLDISIPVLAHRPGRVETNKILGFRFFKEDPRKHFIIHEINELNDTEIIDEINHSEENNKLIVFIHGFNVSFKDAAFKAAQIKYDLEIKHPVLLLSWPSHGSFGKYTADVRATVSSADTLRNFIASLDSSSLKSEEIIFIAHSMGTYCLSQIIHGVSANFKKLSRAALAAADLSRLDFVNNYAADYLAAFKSVSLYVHSNDRALGVSKKINSYELVGDSSSNVFTHKDFDTIETSSVSHNFFSLNHSYVFENEKLLKDLREFLVNSTNPLNRGLKKVKVMNSLDYWELNP